MLEYRPPTMRVNVVQNGVAGSSIHRPGLVVVFDLVWDEFGGGEVGAVEGGFEEGALLGFGGPFLVEDEVAE